MLKTLLELLRKDDLLDQAIEETNLMFQKAQQIYQEAISVLKENRQPEFEIYKVDQEINSLEKKIRRKILENISFNPRKDIAASLVLTSIIIDIERIGDYSKNIFELTQLKLENKKLNIDEKLVKDADLILEKFTRIGKVMTSGDKEEAKLLIEELNPIKKCFDEFIIQSVRQCQNAGCDMIVSVLFSRYLKRVSGHLSNIVSSITNPFDKIGFYHKNYKEEID